MPVFSQNAQDEGRIHYEIGKRYYQQGRYLEAQQEFRKALFFAAQQSPQQSSISSVLKSDNTFENQSASVDISVRQPVMLQADEVQSARIKVDAQAPGKAAKEDKADQTAVYTVGEEDVLHISVWQNEDLNGDFAVRPDGMISVPLVGDISVIGMTLTQLRQALTDKLTEYIKYPEVIISVAKLGGHRILVLGQVGGPGVYTITGTKRILEVLAMAGSVSPDGVLSSVMLLRGSVGKLKPMKLDLNRAILKGDMTQNVIIQPEDIIYVPKKLVADFNYFMTQVIGPLLQANLNTQQFVRPYTRALMKPKSSN